MTDAYRELRYRLAGPMAPLPVFYKEDLSIDHAAMEGYVDWLLNRGAKNLCFTFVYSQLDFITTEELREVTRTVTAVTRDRGTLVACTAGGPVHQAVQTTRDMLKAGADAVMVHQPEWIMQNGGTGSLMVHYLKTVCSETDGAIMCCLLPDSGSTRTPLLDCGAFEQLIEHENFIGLKDDVYQVPCRMALTKQFGDRLAIVGGGLMRQYVLFHRFPCQGEFCGHFNPPWAARLFKLLDDNNYLEALPMIEESIEAAWAPEGVHWLAAVHARFHALGFVDSCRMRPPLQTVTAEQAEAIAEHARQHPGLFVPKE